MTVQKDTWRGFALGVIVGVVLVQLHVIEFLMGFFYGLFGGR